MDLAEFHPRYFNAIEHADVAVVKFEISHLNDEENIEELGHELFALVDQFGFRKVVLNMGCVEYVTSSVVGKIITLHRKLHRSDGQLVISNLTPGVNEVLTASRLLSYFKVAPTEPEALASLSA